MKWGFSSYALTWSIGVPGYEKPIRPIKVNDLLQIAKKHNISLIQIADNLPLDKLSSEELMKLGQDAAQLGITLEVGTRGTQPEHLLKYLHIAQTLDAKLFRTLIEVEDLSLAKEHILQVLPHFEAAGIPIAIENHGLHTTKQLTDLFDELDSAFVGSCLDTVNSFGALENPNRVIERLVPYILNLHVKDFEVARLDHQMGFQITGTPAGTGRLNMIQLLETLHRQQKSPSAILELWVPYQGSTQETIALEKQWFEESLLTLRKILQDWEETNLPCS